jgi:hypothetical protein
MKRWPTAFYMVTTTTTMDTNIRMDTMVIYCLTRVILMGDSGAQGPLTLKVDKGRSYAWET